MSAGLLADSLEVTLECHEVILFVLGCLRDLNIVHEKVINFIDSLSFGALEIF